LCKNEENLWNLIFKVIINKFILKNDYDMYKSLFIIEGILKFSRSDEEFY